MRRILIGTGAAALAVGAGGWLGWPLVATAHAAPAPNTKPHRARPHGRPVVREAMRLLRRSDYLTMEVHYHHGWRTVIAERGVLVSGSSTALVIQRPDGTRSRVTTSSATHYLGVKPASMAAGDRVRVVEVGSSAVRVSIHAPGHRATPGSTTSAVTKA